MGLIYKKIDSPNWSIHKTIFTITQEINFYLCLKIAHIIERAKIQNQDFLQSLHLKITIA
jgi:hypothetical protein